MKKGVFLSLILFASMLTVSCLFQENDSEDSGNGTIADTGSYIQICAPFASGPEDSRTAVPSASGSSFPVKSYVITASTSGMTDVSATVGKDKLASKKRMSLEKQGIWTLAVYGYASEDGSGTAICSGTGSISVSAAPYYGGQASVTVYPSGSGTGTLSLNVSVPSSVRYAEAALTSPDGTSYAASYTDSSFTISSLVKTGAAEASSAFAAGKYTLDLCLYASAAPSSDSIVYRRTEQVAVWNGFRTDSWVDAYTLASGSTTAAASYSTLAVTDADLSDTDTSCTMSVPAKNINKTLSGNTVRLMMGEADSVTMCIAVPEGKTVTVTDGSSQTVTPSSVTGSSGSYTLTYLLASPATAADNRAGITIYAKNGIASQSTVVIYGPEYVSSSGSDDNDGSKKSPYATIAKAVSMLPSSSDTNNKIILQSDMTTNTVDSNAAPANGYAANSSLVSFSSATTAAPLVLTIDGGGHTIDAGGTSASNRRVMYVGSNVTLTLQNVTLAGGYSDNGGGVYMNGGTLNLQSGAKIGYTAGTTAASDSSCSSYASVNGGGIYMAADTGAAVNMYDGAYISYNYCAGNGGGVYLDGTSATNRNTFKMYGGKISCNTALYECGGLFLLYTTDSFMEGGSIEYNKTAAANGGGGGINIFNGATFTMSGGSINNNSANTKGGGVFVRWDGNNGHENYFIMTGGVISGNTAAKGSGVANDYSFTIGGSAVVAADNDVYLDKLASSSYVPCVTVADGYSIPSGYSYGAVITWYGGNDSTGSKVLAPESGSLSHAKCNMFALTKLAAETNPTTAGISDMYCIASDGTNGVIAKAGAWRITQYTPTRYSLSADKTSFVQGVTGNVVTLVIKDSTGDEYTGTPTTETMSLYQNGVSTGITSATGTLTIPSYLPADTYQLHLSATINDNAYSVYTDITVGGYSGNMVINGTELENTGAVAVIEANSTTTVAMTDDSSWSGYYSGTETSPIIGYKGVFLKDRTVQLSAYIMGQYEVTQELYTAVMDTNPSNFASDAADGETQSRRPVENLNWYDALVFCNKLSELMGYDPCYTIVVNESATSDTSKWGDVPTAANTVWDAAVCDLTKNGYRLPTEAEWEFAARGGNATEAAWKYAYAGVAAVTTDITSSTTDAKLANYAWYDGNAGNKTHEVGTKSANALGLYDMSGNVWEWCWDWYKYDVTANDSKYTNEEGVVVDPLGAASSTARVRRGGCWCNASYGCAVSHREFLYAYSRCQYNGFRVCRTAK